MSRIRDLLDQVAHKLALNRPLLERARRRRRKFTARAEANHELAVKTQKRADRRRAEGRPAAAQRLDRKAARAHHRASQSSQKAQWWIARIKLLLARLEDLGEKQADLEAELAEWKREHGVSIDTRANKVTGGTARQRIRAAALLSAARCASGKRANFYSQPGAFTTDACFTGERSGERSDCSQWIASVYAACGLEIPGTWTGDMVTSGKQIPRDQLESGDLVIYGSGSGFHVELYVGPGDKTIGHGSAPIDPGTVDLLGNGDFRCFTYLND